MIPDFTDNGLLPPGIHVATWDEFCSRFGKTRKRKKLIEHIKEVINILERVGCTAIYIDGSFVTERQRPNDFDACWSKEGVNLKLLNQLAPALKHAPNKFKLGDCKSIYKGDVFPCGRLVPNPLEQNSPTDPDAISFLDFFQIDKETLQPKGIILLKLDQIIL